LGNVNICPGSGVVAEVFNKVDFYDCGNVAAGGCGLSWDPHSSNSCAVAARGDLKIINTSSLQVSMTVLGAHRGCIRDVDYNPNKPNVLVTSGDDCKLKIWDLRHTKAPLKTLCGHSHWAWSAKYNPSHDQLMISGGSDHVVNLWRISSVSSMPWEAPVVGNVGVGASGEAIENQSHRRVHSDGGEDEEEEYYGAGGDTEPEPEPVDIKVLAIDQHEDSVYSTAWSPCEAWMFCSLSYDGRIILSHVPSTEKYKILL